VRQRTDTARERWRDGLRLLRLLVALYPQGMALNAVATLLIGLAPLLTLVVLRQVVDVAARAAGEQGAQGAPITPVLGWVAALVGAMSLEGTAWFLGRYVRDRIQEEIKARVQEQVIAKAQSLPLAAFEQSEYYDQLQRIENGLDARFYSTMAFLFQTGNQVVTLTALMLYVGAAHWSLPLLMAAGTAPFAMLRVRLFKERYIVERKQTERQRRRLYLTELMTGREAGAELRLFGLGDHLMGLWSRLHRELGEERLAIARRQFHVEGVGAGGQSVAFGLVLTLIVYLAARGSLTLGQYAAFFGAVQRFQDQLLDFLWNLALIDNDLRYIGDFFQYLDLPEEASDRANGLLQGKRPAEPLRHGIVFEAVRFVYPGSERAVLDRLDLHLRPGERVALVGENGSGKTTLARLLLGLYPPTEGRILVDGIDLAEVAPSSWRRRTAAVFQEFQQYHLTVRENIAFGDLERAGDLAAIKRAARLSGADGVVATLPDGMETLLGKEFADGVELSLGQWQKIAVARAYLRDAEVLVLDEPTAALDARAEVEIYRQFRDVSQGKTVLLISHRLGSARLADRILVLDGGRIAEEGTHAELMQRDGMYARMLGVQAQWYA
jgi:ABC-type multidrug transport system fused ATPase/permease subunit